MSLSRARRFVYALGAAALLVVGPSLSAQAASENLVSLGADGSETTVTVPLLGSAVVVPGDASAEILTVRNDGESEGILTVEIVDVILEGAPHAFFDDFLINDTPASELGGLHTEVLRQTLAVGESVTVPFSYEFPVDSVEGSAPGPDPGLSFDVLLTLSAETGDLPATGAEVPVPLLIGAILAVALGAVLTFLVRRRGRDGADAA